MTLPPVPPPASAAAPAADAAATYRERGERAAAALAALAARGDRLANLRLVAFALAAAALAATLWSAAPPLVVPTALLLALFVWLVVYHRRVDVRRDRAARRVALNAAALARLDRRWDDLPLRHTRRPDPQHPYARDLDVYGPGSLLHLLEQPATPAGGETLAAWLAGAAPPEAIAARQAAVADLAPRLDLRQDLAIQAGLLGDPPPDPEPFLRWSVGAPWLTERPLLLWASRAAPLLLLLTALASATGLVAYPLWLGALALNAGLHLALSGRALDVIDRAVFSEGAFRAYAGALRLVSAADLSSPSLRRLQGRLAADGAPAHVQMERLYRLTGFALPGTHLLYLPVQLATLWNVHLLAVLEGWQRRWGAAAAAAEEGGGGPRRWLAALGEVEALAALAGLAYDNPDWAVPGYAPAASAAGLLDAPGLAHPLLPAAGRVANDVRVGPAGTFLLVTGSNMAGKSTMLRAVGVNVVLAGAGAPVCARAFRLPPLTLWTAMRIEDSLTGGVSTFLAEARRLKAVLDAAGPGLLYLLDEPFRGTNARERRVAVQRVVAHLVARGAIGAVATHDLDLADEPFLAPAARPVHFAETVVDGAAGPGMRFDYLARPGLAQTTNALRVLELVGLPVAPPPGAAAAPGDGG